MIIVKRANVKAVALNIQQGEKSQIIIITEYYSSHQLENQRYRVNLEGGGREEEKKKGEKKYMQMKICNTF